MVLRYGELLRRGYQEGLCLDVTFRRYPQRRFGGVFELPNLFASLAHTAAGVAVGGIDDPVVGTTGIDESGEPVLVLRRRRDATVYPILGRLERHVYFLSEFPHG